MDSLNLLALAAWTEDGDERLLNLLHQRPDSNLLMCLFTCSAAMSKAMGDFMEHQHQAHHISIKPIIKWFVAMNAGRVLRRSHSCYLYQPGV